LELLREACYYVDEANEIMRDMRPDLEQKFDVDFVWDIFRRVQDVIVIRVIQRPAFREGTDNESMVLFYWTYQSFSERLGAMRGVYNAFVNKGRWDGANNPFEDPWMEASLIDLRQQMQVEKATAMLSMLVRSESPSARTTTAGPSTVSTARDAPENSQMAILKSSASAAAVGRHPSPTTTSAGRRTASAGRTTNRVTVARRPVPSTSGNMRNERNRTGVGTHPSISSMGRSAGDRTSSPGFAQESSDRSASPTQVQRRRPAAETATEAIGRGNGGSNVANVEIERLKRDNLRHLAEIRRLKTEQMQESRERSLQDELIDSLRSQLKDKTELVATLHILMQDRTRQDHGPRSDGGNLSGCGSLLVPSRISPQALAIEIENGMVMPSLTSLAVSAGEAIAAVRADRCPDVSVRTMSGSVRTVSGKNDYQNFEDHPNGSSLETATPRTPERASLGAPVAVETTEGMFLREQGSVVAPSSSMSSLPSAGRTLDISSTSGQGSSIGVRVSGGGSAVRVVSPAAMLQPLLSGIPRGAVRAGSPPPTQKVRPVSPVPGTTSYRAPTTVGGRGNSVSSTPGSPPPGSHMTGKGGSPAGTPSHPSRPTMMMTASQKLPLARVVSQVGQASGSPRTSGSPMARAPTNVTAATISTTGRTVGWQAGVAQAAGAATPRQAAGQAVMTVTGSAQSDGGRGWSLVQPQS